MLDHFGVREATWREAIAKDPHFAESETPHFIGRAVVALASDPNIMTKSGTAVATWNLAKEYGFRIWMVRDRIGGGMRVRNWGWKWGRG